MLRDSLAWYQEIVDSFKLFEIMALKWDIFDLLKCLVSWNKQSVLQRHGFTEF